MTQTISLEKIPGIKIGHAHDKKALTGCTVILCEDGATAGYDLRGSAPGTRETELLRPGCLIEQVHGILLTGGSAFGLDAAGGVQQFLEEKNKGYDARAVKVPIVPAAVIFDLGIGDGKIRPDKNMGYRACVNARANQADCGMVGVGIGATVGKIAGMSSAMSGGFGYTAEKLDDGVIISAAVVVNALGDIIDPENGRILAGARDRNTGQFLNTIEVLKKSHSPQPPLGTNTTLGVVMTNAFFDKVQINKIAQMAQAGLARVVRPAHTMYDGDLIFAVSCGNKKADVNLIGDRAAECISRAVIRAVKISNNLP